MIEVRETSFPPPPRRVFRTLLRTILGEANALSGGNVRVKHVFRIRGTYRVNDRRVFRTLLRTISEGSKNHFRRL